VCIWSKSNGTSSVDDIANKYCIIAVLFLSVGHWSILFNTARPLSLFVADTFWDKFQEMHAQYSTKISKQKTVDTQIFSLNCFSFYFRAKFFPSTEYTFTFNFLSIFRPMNFSDRWRFPFDADFVLNRSYSMYTRYILPTVWYRCKRWCHTKKTVNCKYFKKTSIREFSTSKESKTLNPHFRLNEIQALNPHFTEKTLCLHYKDQFVNSV
jgi:hypothetical protein